jgi:hypothetical protein
MWGRRGIAALLFNLVIRWRGMITVIPWPLYPQGKSFQYPESALIIIT